MENIFLWLNWVVWKSPGWWIGCISEVKGVGLDYLTIKTSVNKALGTYDFWSFFGDMWLFLIVCGVFCYSRENERLVHQKIWKWWESQVWNLLLQGFIFRLPGVLFPIALSHDATHGIPGVKNLGFFSRFFIQPCGGNSFGTQSHQTIVSRAKW